MKIPPKEANLFLKSDICKEFEWLVLELDKYKIPELKEKDFEKLSLQYQMFLEQNWYSLFKRTQKEWKIEKGILILKILISDVNYVIVHTYINCLRL